jgi:hypothetical protein
MRIAQINMSEAFGGEFLDGGMQGIHRGTITKGHPPTRAPSLSGGRYAVEETAAFFLMQ